MRLALLFLLAGCATARGPASLEMVHLQSTRDEAATAQELLRRARGTVFVFWSGGCPCVRRYQARVEVLAEQWRQRGIAFVQVSSNAGEDLSHLTREVERRGLQLPVWRDAEGALSQALGANSTPTVVLVARDGTVLFRGWIDNEREPGEPDREAWLEDALEAFTTHHPVAAASPTYGCTITRSLTPARTCHTR